MSRKLQNPPPTGPNPPAPPGPPPPRETITAGGDCLAYAQMQPDGTANVRVIRVGKPTLSIVGVDVVEAKATNAATDTPGTQTPPERRETATRETG